jgi:phage terminase small subunit
VKQKLAFRATKITEKQRLFISEYQVDFNGTKAAIRAGYSPKRASEMAYQLLQIPTVRQALDRAMEDRLRKIGVHAVEVLTRMARIGFADIRKLYRPDGTLLPPHEWPDEIGPAVAGVETFEEYQGKGENRILVGYTKKVRLWDPNPSLTNMAKNLGLLGNGKHGEKDEDEEAQLGKDLTPLELSPKIVYLVKLAVERSKKIEEKALSGKSLDEKPKELLK